MDDNETRTETVDPTPPDEQRENDLAEELPNHDQEPAEVPVGGGNSAPPIEDDPAPQTASEPVDATSVVTEDGAGDDDNDGTAYPPPVSDGYDASGPTGPSGPVGPTGAVGQDSE